MAEVPLMYTPPPITLPPVAGDPCVVSVNFVAGVGVGVGVVVGVGVGVFVGGIGV